LIKYIVKKRLLQNAYTTRTVLRVIRERQGKRNEKDGNFAER
jgi:hypothetical protein